MVMILALHGYRQNGDIMAKKLKRLKLGTVICPNAPMIVATEGADTLRGWWKLDVPLGEKVKSHISKPHKYIGYQDSIDYLTSSFPLSEVTTIIGFSQGAVLASLLLAHRLLPNAKKAILFSGSPVMDASLLQGTGKIAVPMLSLIGTRDEVTDQYMALQLSQMYFSSELLTHGGGHVIPSDSKSYEIIEKFLDRI